MALNLSSIYIVFLRVRIRFRALSQMASDFIFGYAVLGERFVAVLDCGHLFIARLYTLYEPLPRLHVYIKPY